MIPKQPKQDSPNSFNMRIAAIISKNTPTAPYNNVSIIKLTPITLNLIFLFFVITLHKYFF